MSYSVRGLPHAILALCAFALLALGGAAEAAESRCVTDCKVQCKLEETECLMQVTTICLIHPVLAPACRNVYHRQCRAGGTYCRKVRCETIFNCDEPKPPAAPKPRKEGRTVNDPHLYTFDGFAYDFQAAGEFVLARSLDGEFLVQTRQRPWGTSNAVAVNGAVAMKVGGSRLGFYAGDAPAVRYDGEILAVGDGETVDLADGVSLTRTGNIYQVNWPGEDAAQVRVSAGRWINLTVYPAAAHAGRLEGLLGDFNGARGDDIKPRDGAPLDTSRPISVTDIYGVFGDSWRLSQEESLFDYEPGETTQTFTIPGFPSRHLTLADVDPEARALAESACGARDFASPVVLEDCLFDVGVTGERGFAEDVDDLADITRLAVTTPMSLTDWRQAGAPAAGNWTLSEDGLTVTQSVNGDPTFFVSPTDLIDVTIRGRLRVEAGDDDLIGFVAGYRSPLEEGDAESDFILIDWKSKRQVWSGELADEGLRLVRFKGVADQIAPHFWGAVDGGPVSLLATSHGEGKGWRRDTDHAFELRYGAERVQVFIDGELVFDETGAFQPGRFGFYNYSQPGVVYSDFELTPGVTFEEGH